MSSQQVLNVTACSDLLISLFVEEREKFFFFNARHSIKMLFDNLSPGVHNNGYKYDNSQISRWEVDW